MRFRVGDRVVLDNIRDLYGDFFEDSDSNTVGNRGTVVKVYSCDTISYYVLWDNGSDNGYLECHLKPLEIVND